MLSRRGVDIPSELEPTVRTASGTAAEVMQMLSDEGYRHAYVDGGKTIQGFLSAGPIDEAIITVIPVLLGDGLRLFGPPECDVWLETQEVVKYPFGFIQLRYRVENTSDDPQ